MLTSSNSEIEEKRFQTSKSRVKRAHDEEAENKENHKKQMKFQPNYLAFVTDAMTYMYGGSGCSRTRSLRHDAVR